MTAHGSETNVHVSDNVGVKKKRYFGLFSFFIKDYFIICPQQEISMRECETPCKITFTSLFILNLITANPSNCTSGLTQ